jgi:hypothetical protein
MALQPTAYVAGAPSAAAELVRWAVYFLGDAMRMKFATTVTFLIACCIVSAACQNDTANIGSKVSALLQQKLNNTFGSSKVTVANVVVIHEHGHKYQGLTTISAYGSSSKVKLSILADGKNVIYNLLSPKWPSLVIAVNKQKVKVVKGEYSDIAVNNKQVFSCFPNLLRKEKGAFAERLSTVVPVKEANGFWFGSGCKAHECGSEEAAWAINPKTAKGYAIILSTGKAGKNFSIYDGEANHLPRPLLNWALERGMSDFNSVVIRRPYGSKE